MAKKKAVRGRKPIKGKLVCIKLDQQAIRDTKSLGKKWDTQTPGTIRKALRETAARETDLVGMPEKDTRECPLDDSGRPL